MPHCCSVYGCGGNQRGSPYVKTVKFPEDQTQREKWMQAMPNSLESLKKLKNIRICASHFNCEWINCRGGKRPSLPPSIFPGIQKSSLKQLHTTERKTRNSQHLPIKTEEDIEKLDKIPGFLSFSNCIVKYFPEFNVSISESTVTVSKISEDGSVVEMYLRFSKDAEKCGIVKLDTVKKEGISLSVKEFKTTRKGQITRWTEIEQLYRIITKYNITDKDRIVECVHQLDLLTTTENSNIEFCKTQLEISLQPKNKRTFQKNLIVFAIELFCLSPTTYRNLYKSEEIILPSEKLVRKIIGSPFNDSTLTNFFEKLQPEQRLVNVLFDEVKLKSALRFTAGHIIGYSENCVDKLATSALVFELICHHGGPRLVHTVHPVACLNAVELQNLLMKTIQTVQRNGGTTISVICDNCPLNQKLYRDLGGPGKVTLNPENINVFLVYDYVHIFKNLRNNWITEKTQELSFTSDGKEYLACWADIAKLYEEDKSSNLRLTKLTHTSVYPKTLQRQSVPLVSQVFNEKTAAALKTIELSTPMQAGTILFIEAITSWFKIMNVKNKSIPHQQYNDPDRDAWTLDCPSFAKLKNITDIILSCRWNKSGIRQKKLTKFTADAFVTTTEFNVAAATFILVEHRFNYILPAVFSQDPLEKFFGQARQRNGGNFYIDIGDVVAAAKTQRVHQQLKIDSFERTSCVNHCSFCTEEATSDDVELLKICDYDETAELLETNSTTKEKVIFIAGYLTRCSKSTSSLPDGDSTNRITSDFLDNLNRGGLSIPTFETVHFVHCSKHVADVIFNRKIFCRAYMCRLISLIDAPLAKIPVICSKLVNILLKAHVINCGDVERELGCLRRKEKLQH